jgi:simple sugar transport system substrate-binding protein
MIALVGLSAAACTSSSGSSPSVKTTSGDAASGKNLTIDLITSVPAGDPFYAVVAKAGQVAAQNLGVTVKYISPSTYTTNAQDMSRLIDNAVASKPDGIAATLPLAPLASNIKSAVDAGIPTALFNTGQELLAQTGALAYYGENSLQEGTDMGQRLKAAGVKHVLCPDFPLGVVASLDERCAGVEKGIAPEKYTRVTITSTDAVQWRNAVEAAVQKDPTIDGVVGLGASVSAPTLAARTALGARGTSMKWATFDLGTTTLKGIVDGQYLFAEDQQQFLQAYDAIVAVVLNVRYGLAPGTTINSTSAPVVGQSDAQRLLTLSSQEIR